MPKNTRHYLCAAVLIVLMSLIPMGAVFAQVSNVQAGEYFWDTDPGFGAGTAISGITPGVSLSQTFAPPLSSLTPGMHTLFVRFRNANGHWSTTHRWPVYILSLPSTVPNISQGEYFWDIDPGYGSGTPISSFSGASSVSSSIAVPLSGLTPGLHVLYLRSRANPGNWGQTHGFPVLVLPTPSLPNVSRLEYFWDNDPGFGNGTLVPGFTAGTAPQTISALVLSSLSPGIHTLMVRGKDSNGKWSQTYVYPVVISNIPSTALHVNQLEYFWNTDPGVGNGTAVTSFTSAVSVTPSVAVPLSGLSAGMNTLFFRGRNANGQWGITHRFPVFVATAASSTTVNAYEYFWDTDPGFGAGTSVTSFSASGSVNQSFAISLNGLSPGLHTLYLRAKGPGALYGQTHAYPVLVQPDATLPTVTRIEYFWDTDPGFGLGTLIPGFSAGLTPSVAASALNLTSLTSGIHTLNVRSRDANGRWSQTYTYPVVVTNFNVSPSQITAIESFWDVDPGMGNGTAVTGFTPGTTVSAISSLPLNGLTSGMHTLFFRGRNADGHWGITQRFPVFVTSIPATSPVASFEYFWNTDPGFGAATQVSGFSPANAVNHTFAIPLTGLSAGIQTLHIRSRNSAGTPGQTYAFPVYVTPVLTLPQLTKLEYWWDTDPGYGSATPVPGFAAGVTPSVTAALPLGNLSPGIHTLGVRGQDLQGRWSVVHTYNVVISNVSSPASNITQVEYFWDVDPGFGAGTPMTGFSAGTSVQAVSAIPLGTLVPGTHVLFTRAKSADGDWSITHRFSVFVSSPPPPPTPGLAQIEYFWDTDPGYGNGVSVPVAPNASVNTNLVVSLSGLTPGVHVLGMRAQDTNGVWGITHPHAVYVLPDLAVTNVSRLEYFWDTDPGFGAGTALPGLVAAPTASVVHGISLSALTQGIHSLTIRGQSSSGKWSVSHTYGVVVLPPSSVASNIVAAEYFWDIDPGFGAGTPVSGITAGPSIAPVLSLPLGSLTPGMHTLFVRGRDANGGWSTTHRFPVFVQQLSTLSPVTQFEYFWDTDPGYGLGTVISGFPPANNVGQNLVVPVSGLQPGVHVLHFRATNQDALTGQTYAFPVWITPAFTLPDVTRLEYFWDADPGIGQGTSVTISSSNDVTAVAALPLSGLNTGIHTLAVRAQDNRGAWSVSHTYSVVILDLSGLSNITAVEYFWDTDPGYGSGTAITGFSSGTTVQAVASVALGSLVPGPHVFFVRARDAKGGWSTTHRFSVFVSTPPPPPVPGLAQLEYFWDTDPGYGNGTGVALAPNSQSNTNIAVSTSGLAPGIHVLGMRAQDTNGVWGITHPHPVYMLPAFQLSDVTRVEYFWNADPGYGNATALSGITPSASVSVSQAISMSGLSQGLNYLTVRSRDTQGKWSVAHTYGVLLTNFPITLPDITSVEYFWNTDPGFGQGTPVSGFVQGTQITHAFNIPLNSLSNGINTLFVRGRNALGEWSTTHRFPVLVAAPQISAPVSQFEYFWDTDPGFGNGSIISGFTPGLLANQNIAVSLGALSPGVHVLGVRSADTLNQWGITHTFPVYVTPPLTLDQVIRVEYYWDTDPGFGAGNALSGFSPNTEVSATQAISLSGLTQGIHSLVVRSKSLGGQWSVSHQFSVLVTNLPSSPYAVDALEYFWNTDPGIGNATAVAGFTAGTQVSHVFNIPTSALNTGMNTLFVRGRNSNGDWGIVHRYPVFITSIQSAAPIASLEYFWDNDPGIGNATTVSGFSLAGSVNQNVVVPMASLSPGVHVLGIRAADSTQLWGMTHTFPVYVTPDLTLDNVAAIEYFWDTDPGYGNATSLSGITPGTTVSSSQALSLSALNPGIHSLMVRSKSATGKWSVAHQWSVLIINTPPLPYQVTAIEYFWNTDPGYGNGVTVSGLTPSTSVSQVLPIPMTGLANGMNSLFIRAQNANGEWSTTHRFPVYVVSISQPTPVAAFEYFWDTDPGYGNGTNVSSFSPAGSVNQNIAVSLLGVNPGLKTLYIRSKDSLNVWGQTYAFPVYITPALTLPQVSQIEYFWDVDPGYGNATSLSGFTVGTEVTVPSAISISQLQPGLRTLTVRAKSSDGTWSVAHSFQALISNVAPTLSPITAIEYFWDTDPGIGNASPITAFVSSDTVNTQVAVPVGSLPVGSHVLFIRAKNAQGHWGLTHRWSISITAPPIPLPAAISSFEYFWNTDPGLGNATTVSSFTQGIDVNHSFAVPLSGLNAGLNTLVLRAIDTTGKVGHSYPMPIFIVPSQTVSNLTQVEYFWDTDPGFGNGTALTGFLPAAEISVNHGISLASVTPGIHTLTVRGKDQLGRWSVSHTYSVIITNNLNPAPDVTAIEYFWNTDPGIGNGTNVPVTSPGIQVTQVFNIPLNALNAGTNTLFIRSKNQQGAWSITHRFPVFITAPVALAPVQRLEYFWDTDPGYGNGVAVTGFSAGQSINQNVAISLASVNPGLRVLHFRAQDTTGKWGHTYPYPVYITPNLALSNVNRVEYFWDVDPGYGNGTAISGISPNTEISTSQALPLSGLTPGIHTLTVRARSNEGRWSVAHTYAVIVSNMPAQLENITAIEYFWNTDPGMGNATSFTGFSPATQISQNMVIPVSGLNQGMNTLFIRSKSLSGQWSITHRYPVYVGGLSTAAPIAAFEYFWNTDPGYGNGAPVTGFTLANDVNHSFLVPLSGVNTGLNTLHIRAIDSTTRYGQTYAFPVYMVPNPTLPNLTRLEYYWDTDPGFGNGTAITGYTPGNEVTAAAALTLSSLNPGIHTLAVRGRDAQGRWSVTHTFGVVVSNFNLPAPNITAIEYFWDTDPGIGNGTAVTSFTPSDTVSTQVAIPLTIAAGPHVLFIRAKNALGHWSITHRFAVNVTLPPVPPPAPIARFEYFWDTDPGLGNATSVTGFANAEQVNYSFAVPMTGLNAGLHTLVLRAIDSTNKVGHSYPMPVFIVPPTNLVNIDRLEYFWDNDPGYGNGSAVVGFVPGDTVTAIQAIPMQNLTPGFHTLTVRSRTSDGRWSVAHSYTIFVTTDPNPSNITRIEYFWNTDPGMGNGVNVPGVVAGSLVNQVFSVNLSGLSQGVNTLFVRSMNAKGDYSITHRYPVFVGQSGNAPISRFEYFWDTDPGFGAGTQVTSFLPATNVNQNIAIPLTNLNPGVRTLFVRSADTLGRWGGTYAYPVYLVPASALPQVSRLEYFWNTDPGFGNATAIGGLAASAQVTGTTAISLSGLPVGVNYLNIRAKDADGRWSATHNFNVVVVPIGNGGDVTALEYFWDTDPGKGNANAVTNFTASASVTHSFPVSMSGLSQGLHLLYVRGKNQSGDWGITHRFPVFVADPNQGGGAPITRYEYFWDTDPGMGSATQVTGFATGTSTNHSFNIALSGLTPGLRTLHVRPADSLGRWGITHAYPVYVMPDPTLPNITRMEYFWDADPGIGNATAISITPGQTASGTLAIPLSSLATGLHTLSVRSRDAQGRWSVTHTWSVIITNLDASPQPITAVEYFWNTDPGMGNATALTSFAPATSVSPSFAIPVGNLPSGLQTLFIRAKNQSGAWSITHRFPVLVQSANALASAPIQRFEYFIDTDPGYGAATQVSTFSPASQVNQNILIPLSGLAEGIRNIGIRAMDTLGRWGQTYQYPVYLLNTATSQVAALEYYWDTDPGFGSATAIPVSPSTEVSTTQALPLSNLNTGIHNLTVRAKSNTGRWSVSHHYPVFVIDQSLLPDTVTQVEYFFDVDPGMGQASSISGITPGINVDGVFPIPLNNLAQGLHQIFIRAKNRSGHWGITHRFPVYILNQQVTPEVVAAEYFIDTDPGFGAATPVPAFASATDVNLNLAVSLSNLSQGIHRLYVRTQDNSGVWGHTFNEIFTLMNIPATPVPLAKGEYFWDVDPGFNNGTNIPGVTSAVLNSLSFTIPAPPVAPGVHTLYTRYQDTLGRWGHTHAEMMIVYPGPDTVRNLVGLEYFIDTDPGLGQATFVPFTTPSPQVTEVVNLPICGLASGNYTLYVRVKDEDGRYGQTYAHAMSVTNNGGSLPISLSQNGPICTGDTLSLLVTHATFSSPAITYTWTGPNGFNQTVSNPSLFNAQASASGMYTVTVTNPLINCSGVDSIMVLVSSGAPAPVVLSPDTICNGANVLLTAFNTNTSQFYWWDAASGGNIIDSGSTFLSQAFVNNTMAYEQKLFYVSANDTVGCSGSRTTATVLVRPLPGSALNQNVVYQAQGTTLPVNANNCIIVSPDQWVRFVDGNNALIASVKEPSGSSNLGATQATATLVETNVAVLNGKPFLPKVFTITPASQPGPNDTVSVRLYFTQEDFDSLNFMAGGGFTMNELQVRKYSANLTGSQVLNPAASGFAPVMIDTSKITVLDSMVTGLSNVFALQFPLTSFSTFFIEFNDNPTPLPVTLTEWEANCDPKGIRLDWTTQSELNNQAFFVDRSLDGEEWSRIATIPGAGNSNVVKHYSHVDGFSYPGWVYYRLTQQDFDGTTEVFYPVSAFCDGAETGVWANASPNPTFGKSTISHGFGKAGVRWELMDVSGRILQRGVDHNEGFNIDLNAAAPGTYVLRLEGVLVQETISLRIIKAQ